jgi:uncharacterized repeat protein (TIGR03803 family)
MRRSKILTKPFAYLAMGALAAFALAATPARGARATSTTTVIYSFAGDEDGEYPSTDLVMDKAGNFYGTSVQGGDFGGGTVFQLSRSGNTWVHTVLYSFMAGADGGQPYGGVTLDPEGNLYGTGVVGGSGGTCVEDGCGVVYKLTNNGGTWTESVIHDFTGGDDGYGPGSPVTLDKKGAIYGMTPTGGAYGLGVIYQLKLDRNGQWRLDVIHAFTGGNDGGSGSAGRLLLDGHGNVYGVATVGGAHGSGTAFKLTRSHNKWRFRTLYAFKGMPDAGFPYGGLTFDGSGNLYGTTYYDGANDLGSVYELSYDNGVWTESVLYSFVGGSDGSNSISSLVFDDAGNLYGTTSEGGAPGCSCGTVFKLSNSDGKWTETVAYAFTGVPDGAFAYNGLVSDEAGNFYGTTVHGGADDEGSIYQFTP